MAQSAVRKLRRCREAFQLVQRAYGKKYAELIFDVDTLQAPQLFVFDPIALHTVLIKEHHVFEEPPAHLGLVAITCRS